MFAVRFVSVVVLAVVVVVPTCGWSDQSPVRSEVARSVEKLQADTDGGARVEISRATGTARLVGLRPGDLPLKAGSLEGSARDFFDQYGVLFGLHDAATELLAEASTTDPYGISHQTFNQVHRGIPVFAGLLRAHSDGDGNLVMVNGTFVPDLWSVDTQPEVVAAVAESSAVAAVFQREDLGAGAQLSAFSTTLVFFRSNLARGVPGRAHLVWQVEVADRGLVLEMVFIDAHTGALVDRIATVHDLERIVFDDAVSAVAVWREGDDLPYESGEEMADLEINTIINASGETYRVFANVSGGEFLSWNGTGGAMRSTYRANDMDCPNASSGGGQTWYCAGVAGDDTVAHEWAHAYTSRTHRLVYQWQPGALNEAYSDIFGEVVDLLNGTGTDEPDLPRVAGECSSYGSIDPSVRWLSAEDDPAFGGAIRDMWSPHCFGDPGKVSDSNYFCSTSDNGGVHSNSGVPNHAFALLVDGGIYNDVTVEALGMTRATHIYWRAMRWYQERTTGFEEHADYLEISCQDLIGAPLTDIWTGELSSEVITAADCDQVSAAMDAVEMRLYPAQCGWEVLDSNPPQLDGYAEVFAESFDSDPFATWSVSNQGVSDSYQPRDWQWLSTSPVGGEGGSIFAVDSSSVVGDCADETDDQAGVMYLTSPDIQLPSGRPELLLVFDHYVATDVADGGNLKISVNGGPFAFLSWAVFKFNSYNTFVGGYGSNPLAGQFGFSGTNVVTSEGSWGQTQVDLGMIAEPGDTITLRFDFGVDACGGVDGWYLDNLRVLAETGASRPGGGRIGG